jgi:hypothetical protein
MFPGRRSPPSSLFSFSSLLSALRLAFAVVVFLARVLPSFLPSFHASFHGSYNPWPITRSGVAAEEETKVV